MKKRFVLATILVVMATLAMGGNALAAGSSQSYNLYRPIPEGIASDNAGKALAQVQSRASWDARYANVLAAQTGATSYNPNDYRSLGYQSKAPAGTDNSAVNDSGEVVPVADHDGSQNVRVLLVINIKTNKTVAIMVRCGNPRLAKNAATPPLPWKPFQADTVAKYKRMITKPVSITCPSGQKVFGTVTTTVTGFARARTWGKVQGNLNLKLRQHVQLKLKTLVDLKCGPGPKIGEPAVAYMRIVYAKAHVPGTAMCPAPNESIKKDTVAYSDPVAIKVTGIGRTMKEAKADFESKRKRLVAAAQKRPDLLQQAGDRLPGVLAEVQQTLNCPKPPAPPAPSPPPPAPPTVNPSAAIADAVCNTTTGGSSVSVTLKAGTTAIMFDIDGVKYAVAANASQVVNVIVAANATKTITITAPGMTTVTKTVTGCAPPAPSCPNGTALNQLGKCVQDACPSTEKRFTRTAQPSGYAYVPSGAAGVDYSVWFDARGMGFWGYTAQIPAGAVSGNAACYKPAPPAGGGSGGPPPSP